MKNQAEIYQALLDGETLVNDDHEVSLIDGYVTSNGIRRHWAFIAPREWSITPKPMDIWVNVYDGVCGGCTWGSEDQARRTASSGAKQVLFREVMEGE